MPSLPAFPSRECLPALVLLVVAAALAANGAWLVYDDFRPEYRLSVTETEVAPVDGEAVAYDDLPPEARVAFDEARDDPYVIHQKPAFLETFPVYQSVYVRADGTVYETWVSADGVNGLSLLLAMPLGLSALGLGILGGWSYRTRRVRLPSAVLAGVGAAGLVSIAWPVLGSPGVRRIPVVPALLLAVVVSTAVWFWFLQSDVA